MVQTCLDISSNNSVVSLLDVLECIIFVIAHLAVISKGLKDPLLRGEVKGSHDVNIHLTSSYIHEKYSFCTIIDLGQMYSYVT